MHNVATLASVLSILFLSQAMNRAMGQSHNVTVVDTDSSITVSILKVSHFSYIDTSNTSHFSTKAPVQATRTYANTLLTGHSKTVNQDVTTSQIIVQPVLRWV